MFRKCISILMILGLLISGLGACSKKEYKQGNTSGNINNNALFAQQGEWVYYSNVMSDYHLMKMKVDGSQVSELTDEIAISINIIDEWIYYMSSPEFEIFKMKTDGSSKTRLGTAHATYFGNIIVQNDMIYFANADEGNTLHSMKTDGTDLRQLGQKEVFRISVDGEWIYYMSGVTNPQTYETAFELRKMKTNGQGDISLEKQAGINLVVDQNWIYFTSASENNKLYRIKTDGKDKTKISNENIASLNIANGKIYFTTQQDYKLKVSALDGTSVSNLIADKAIGVYIVGDWIYFSNMKYLGRLYKVKLDGTLLQKAYTFEMVSPNPVGTEVVKGLGRPNRSGESSSTIVRSGDWLFYTNNQDTISIYKMKLDGSEETEVTSHAASYLNVVGDWLYFIDMFNKFSIARIKKDGTQYGVILDIPCNELIVRDEWMYFTDMSQDRKIYKVKIDGTDLTKLSDDSGLMIQLVDDQILYTIFPLDYSSIYKGIRKVNTDGTNKSVLINSDISAFTADEDYIYYSEYSDIGVLNIRKTNMTGTIDVLLVDDYATLFGVKDGWVYYNDGYESGGLKRVSTDGKKKQNLKVPGNFSFFHFIEDKITVYDNDTESFYIMNPCGINQSVWIP